MIIELPNFVDLEFVAQIREAVQPHLSPRATSAYNRDGSTLNISGIPELKEIDEKLFNVFIKVQKDVLDHRYKPAVANTKDSGYEYHIYRPGDVCHVHADSELGEAGALRYASVVLHLNTVNQGGELVFPTQNKSVKTEAGKIVVFPPYGMFQHYTTPSEESREIIVTWFSYSGLTVHRS